MGHPGKKADSSPVKRIRNDKYLKAGSRRGAPRNDKYVKADSVRLREKSPHPFAKNAKGWAPRQKADSSPLKRIRNDKYMKAGSSRGAPPIDKYVKADSLRLNGKVPTLSQRTRKGWGTPAKSRFLTAEADSE